MAHRTVHRLACIVSLLAVTSATEQTRWSRQLSSYTSDISDWVPLQGPMGGLSEMLQPQIKRQAIAEPRILTEPFPSMPRPTGFSTDAFPFRNFNTAGNRQLYLQSVPSVPSAPQNFLTDQGFGQSHRFGLSQPSFPLSQGFVAPFGFDNVPPPPKPRIQPIITDTMRQIMNQVSFPQASGVPLSVQAKPFLTLPQNTKTDAPKFVDGYRAEKESGDVMFASKKKPQSLQKIKYESGEKFKPDIVQQNSKSERGEEVQLLYVPVDQLNRGPFNFKNPTQTSHLVNSELYPQALPRPGIGKQSFLNEFQKPAARPVDAFSGPNYYADFNAQLKDVDQVSKYSTLTTPFTTYAPTTPKPKKLKPHQPPLAIFMTKNEGVSSQIKVGDVLSSLKNAQTIAVLDSVNPLNAPKVFIGPSNLPPPENFVKFELPYLSNLDHSDSKLKQLPFFVAPLSYNTPNGFAKIPFPSPHVGSVVINSQIKETAQTQAPSQPSLSSVHPNYYTATSPTPTYKPEAKPVTQKPTFSYYSTASLNTKPAPNYQSNYYSFEPQTVSTLRPPAQLETQTAPPKGSYFLSNPGPQYNPQEFVNFRPQNNYKPSEPIEQYNFQSQPDYSPKVRQTTTTTSTTTKPPSTYPSQLLETHNPYSINQAFHFSTPLDYHNYFDDVKQPYVTPGSVGLTSPSPSPSSPTSPSSPSSPAPKPDQEVTKPINCPPQYVPELNYNSEQSLKYPVYNPNDESGETQASSQHNQPCIPVYNTPVNKFNTHDSPINKYNTKEDSPVNQYPDINPAADNYNIDPYHNKPPAGDTPVKIYNPVGSYNEDENTPYPAEPARPSDTNNLPTASDADVPAKYDKYNTYKDDSEEVTSSTTTTSTTTTRRTPIRSRGRPRYTTTPRSDSHESTTKTAITRRPLKERRPSPTRSKYEPSKTSTEKPTTKSTAKSTTKPSEKPIKKSPNSSESTTKPSKLRNRGRIHYKPSDDKESHRRKTYNSKEEDLAYQRDVLHQNYPVTLMERTSTVDIEAITEPTRKQTFDINQEPITETIDTENAYTYERASITEQEEPSDVSPLSTYNARSTAQTETPYVPNVPSSHNEEYYYQSRSSIAPVEPSSYDEGADDKEEDIYVKQTTPVPKSEITETIADSTEVAPTEQNVANYPSYNEYDTIKQEEGTTVSETEIPTIVNNHDSEEEENIVQTTPSYNRVRVRPGVIRQYHQASSTESSKNKERRRLSQPVTYRPAFDKRRTTMRIDEIEADLKTKQVHARPEQEYRHPVYKPEPTTESAVASQSTTESATKRGHFRRRRPSYSYSTTSTEAPSTKRVYEVKNRFRGRRPTEKPTEKPDAQTEAPVSTTRSLLHSRYSHRPRLSERYNKKPETEVEAEDQDSNYSINRPKYAEPETDQWSPKISGDSFKPYNPNDIVDEQKVATTERRSDKEYEMDIITARNEYEDILLTVTPSTNNRNNKKIPDIPPTLEALVEQSKVAKNVSDDAMSTFESMLEEVMKSLEEQDQDEYNTNVMKHKGGEIGEIPPERIISSGDSYVPKSTTPLEESTTEKMTAEDSPLPNEGDQDRKSRRRGFWKKVKVRPVTPESIEFAESQYYSNTVNRLGQPVKNLKAVHEKSEKGDKTKVTTYKPKFQLDKDLFLGDDEATNMYGIPAIDDIQKIAKVSNNEETLVNEESQRTTVYVEKETQTISPGDLDLGTGSPDPTIDDLYLTTPTEPTPIPDNKADPFTFIDFLFGMAAEETEKPSEEKNATTAQSEIIITTEQPKLKVVTTESGYIPEEITTSSSNDENNNVTEFLEIKKVDPTVDTKTEKPAEDITEVSVRKVESSSVSSFMDPANVLSTSMSTEISHETEICFRGKCIKTSKDIL